MSSYDLGIDGSCTVGPRTGVGKSTAALLDALVHELPSHLRVCVWVNSPRYPLPDDLWVRSCRFRIVHTRYPGKLLLRGWQGLGFPAPHLFTGRCRVWHSPAGYPAPGSAAQVLSVHDLYFRERPAKEDPYGGGYFRATYDRNLSLQKTIITFSQETAQAIEGLYRIPAERIAVIPHGVEHDRFRPPGPTGRSEKKEEETVQRLIGPGPYFLAVGTVGVRKNLCALIDAMALLRHGSSEGARLVLVGHPRGGPGLEELERRIAKHRLGFGIVRPGYVPDALIPALYRGALGFCFPSLHEGFGLPILEAMACGTPVLCSGEGAIGEVAGSAAVAIDVRRPDSIATEMRRLAEDSAYRERKAKEGIARAAQFTWRRAARETYAAYLRAGL